MNSKSKTKGFILIYVVAMIPFIGLGTLMMTNYCKSLVWENRMSRIETAHQNLYASCIDWLAVNDEKLKELTQDQPIELTFDQLKIPISKCIITHNGVIYTIQTQVKSPIKISTRTFTLPDNTEPLPATAY